MIYKPGVLILCTGSKVIGPAGTWSRYVECLAGGYTESTPIYGTREDVQHWLVDEFKISREHIATFEEQLARGALGEFYFDVVIPIGDQADE